MKKVIHVPENQDVILTTKINFRTSTLLVFDELPFEKKEVGIMVKIKDKWFIKDHKTKAPYQFRTKTEGLFNSLDEIFIALTIERLSVYKR